MVQLDEAGHRESSRFGRALSSDASPDDGPPILDPFVVHDEPSYRAPAAVVGSRAAVGASRDAADAAPHRLDRPAKSSVRPRFPLGIGLGVGLALLNAGLLAFAIGLQVAKRGPASPEAVATAPVGAKSGSAIPGPDPDDVPPYGTVPQKTFDETIGRIHVVTLGVQESSLESALRREAAAAKATGTEVLLVTTRSGCEPCDGLQASFPHALMQTALERTRVVIVDVDVYGDDLDALGIDRSVLAGFFLLTPASTPRDAIHGGEWGDDVAANIAPVLGPFVRGAFDNRKHDYRAAHRFPVREGRGRPRGLRPPAAAPPSLPAQPPPTGIWL